MTLIELYEIPQLQYDIAKIVLNHSSRINERRNSLLRYLRSQNVNFYYSKNDVRKLLHKIK